MKKTIALLLLLSMSAQATESVIRVGAAPLPQAFDSRAVWPAAVSYQAYKDHDPTVDFKVYMLSMAANSRQSVNLDEMLLAVNQVTARFNETRNNAAGNWRAPEAYREVADIALSVATTGVANPMVKELLTGFGRMAINQGISAYEGYRAPLEQIAAQNELSQLGDTFGSRDRTLQLFSLAEAARGNPQLREAIKITLGSDPLADPRELEARFPEFTQNQMVRELWEEMIGNGGIQHNQEELLGKLNGLMNRMNAGIAEQRQLISDANARLKSLIANARTAEERRAAMEELARIQTELRAQRELEAAQNQLVARLTPDAARAGVYLLSTIAGFSNPRLAQTISGVGENAVRMYESVQKFQEVLSSPALTGTAEALAGAVLTGNILSGMFGIMSALNGQPSPTEILSEQISKMHEELNKMHREMHERFDHIDQMIGIFYEQAMKGFGQIIDQLNTVSVNTFEIQRDLQFALLQLQRIERNAGADFRTTRQIDFESDFLACVNWRQSEATGHGAGTPSLAAFERCLTRFKEFSTIYAVSRLSAGEQRADGTLDFAVIHRDLNMSDSSDQSTLEHPPVEAYVNHLARYARSLSPFVTIQSRLPNPYDWAAGVEGYVQTLMSFPASYMRLAEIGPSVNAMRTTGAHFEEFIRQLRHSAKDSETNKVQSLFHTLLDAYDAKADALKEQLDAQRVRISEETLGGEDLLRNYQRNQLTVSLPENIAPCAQIHPDANQDFKLSPLPAKLTEKLGDVVREAMATGAIETSFCYEFDDSERVHHRETRQVHEQEMGSESTNLAAVGVGAAVAGPIGAFIGSLFESNDLISYVHEWDTVHIKYRIKGYYNKYADPRPGSSRRGTPERKLIFSHVVTDSMQTVPMNKTHTFRNLDDDGSQYECNGHSCDFTFEATNFARSMHIRAVWNPPAEATYPSVRTQFDNNSVAENTTEVETNLNELARNVGSRIGSARSAFYGSILGDGLVANAQSQYSIAARRLLDELSGITDLLRAYASLGLHSEMLAHQDLREMLLAPAITVTVDGQNRQPRMNPVRLVDGAFYREAFMRARGAIANDQVTADAINLSSQLKQRSAALRQVFDRILPELSPNVSFPVVTDTLQRLHLAEKLQRAGRPPRDIGVVGAEVLDKVRTKLLTGSAR